MPAVKNPVPAVRAASADHGSETSPSSRAAIATDMAQTVTASQTASTCHAR